MIGYLETEEMKKKGISQIEYYEGAKFYGLRFTPAIEIDMQVGLDGTLRVPPAPALATLVRHQGYFHSEGCRMEDLPSVGFFCMRLGAEKFGEKLLKDLLDDNRISSPPYYGTSPTGKRLEILREGKNPQILNTSIWKRMMIGDYNITHDYDTSGQYSRNTSFSRLKGLIEDFSAEELSALFNIERNIEAKEILQKGFGILNSGRKTFIDLTYADQYNCAIMFRIAENGDFYFNAEHSRGALGYAAPSGHKDKRIGMFCGNE